jgi:hypothetical protein
MKTASDILESIIHYGLIDSKRNRKPGELIRQLLSEEEKKILKTLKSDDISNIRIDSYISGPEIPWIRRL